MAYLDESTFTKAVQEADVEVWAEHLDRSDMSDQFDTLVHHRMVVDSVGDQQVHEWINQLAKSARNDLDSVLLSSESSLISKLQAVTFLRWQDKIQRILVDCDHYALPISGVVQYFADNLAACILVGYRQIGAAIELENALAFPHPEAFFDPLEALRWARTDSQRELLRRALFMRHKLLIHRNVLVVVDREEEPDVFGPSIDTLFLNEWLFNSRYEAQRTQENAEYFSDTVRRDLARESFESGHTFLEVGCGNGLLTATFARNEARIKRIAAIDVNLNAIQVTYRNSIRQRRFPRELQLSNRSLFLVARYSSEILPNRNDLVVCNPPYIPTHPDPRRSHHSFYGATMGTHLLESVTSDAAQLIGPAGKLVFVISKLALPELERSVPVGFDISKVDEKEVPFDVGPVREDKELLKWLRAERGLKKVGRSWRHSIAIYVVVQKESN